MHDVKGTIISLQVAVARGEPMQKREALRALDDGGLEGDRHGRRGSTRQVLLMDEETLNLFGLEPGKIKENITTRGIALQSLPPGTRLRAGAALLELTQLCAPCEFMDQIRPGLQAAIQGQRGVLARVLEGGEMAVGDAVEVVSE